jgi:hypothetical protein
VHRLDDVAVGAEVQRGQARAQLRTRRDHQHRRLGIGQLVGGGSADLLQQVGAFAVRQAQVQQQEVVGAAAQGLPGAFEVVAAVDLPLLAAHEAGECSDGGGVILDDQDTGHAHPWVMPRG